MFISSMIGGHAIASVAFHVTDSDTKLPVEFAVVALTDGKISTGGYTDAEGHLTLSSMNGTWTLTSGSVGYKPYKNTVTIVGDTVIHIVLTPNDPLGEVVVTATEARSMSSASIIDVKAMRHLQPSSFTDLMSLLPGGLTKDPSMGSVNAISIREASGVSVSDDYASSALGTSFVVDGVPVNTGSQMANTTDTNYSGRNSVGKGVDMRSISTDDIEKVEVVRGIASVEYGEVTSGLVNIKRKSGVTGLEARFKADTQSQLFYLGKGLRMPGDDWTLNVGVDYLDSKIDPRNNRENFKRVTGSVRSNKRWGGESVAVVWNTSLNYTGTFERDKNDPDLTVNNTVDSYENSKHGVSWNSTLSFNSMQAGFFRDGTLTTGISYTDDHTRQDKHVAPSRVMPLPMSLTPGSNYVDYLPMLYLAELDVYSKPMTAFAKLNARFAYGHGAYSGRLKAGAEWNMNKNFGAGRVYDINRPISTSMATRPRSYSDIPAMHQVSAYVEHSAMLRAEGHSLEIVAGLRGTGLLHLDKKYLLHGKTYLDPRINVVWIPAPTYVGSKPITWELAGGFGLHTKMPVASYLYPDPYYVDFEQLNYYHNVPEYRVMNVMTYIEDLTNYNLKPARNLKWEVRGDIGFMGNRLSVTYFREDMRDGFRHSGFVHRYQYRRYDASGFYPYAVGRGPMVEELPYTVVDYQAVRSSYTNGSRTRKEGIEYTFQSRRIPSIKTRVTVSGAYFKTTNVNSQSLWYKPTVIINNRELQYIGLYDDNDGSEYKSFNTNIMFDTDIPSLRLNFSLTVQNVWFTSHRTLFRDGVPTHYMDPEGEVHEFTQASLSDPLVSQLVRSFSKSAFDTYTVPVATTFNIKATKQFWNDRVGLALYVNRIASILPSYRSSGVLIRRYTTPYFGMELNFKI
ncbi:MAG: TonB-dependent receptor [Muribaculum sp.]|nr:TonB-dependent receptor [Muribaculum sp.]